MATGAKGTRAPFKVFCITGPIAAGSEAVTGHIKRLAAAHHVSFSEKLNQAFNAAQARSRGVKEPDRATQQAFANQARSKDKNFLSKPVLEEINFARKQGSQVVVAEKARAQSDIDLLKRRLGRNFVLIAVDAKPELRYERMVTKRIRGDEQQKTYEQFLQDDAKEAAGAKRWQMNVPKLMKQADHHIDNNGDEASLVEQVREILRKERVIPS